MVPAERLDACAQDWVEELLECAPLALCAIKQVVALSLDLPLPEAFARRYERDEIRRRSMDAAEGPHAFAERRPPRWTGR